MADVYQWAMDLAAVLSETLQGTLAKTLGSALAGVIVTFFSSIIYIRWSTKNKADVKNFNYFPANRQTALNRDFYLHMIKCIREAEHDIFISGEGFYLNERPRADTLSLAHDYHDAIKSALRRNVSVVRIQTTRRISNTWEHMLKELMNDFSDRFDLYILEGEALADKLRTANIMSLCVIDPGISSSVVEIMVSSRSLLGTTDSKIAGSAIFIRGSEDLASSFHRHFIDMINDESCKKVSTADELHSIFTS